jgi:hypothetical protein
MRHVAPILAMAVVIAAAPAAASEPAGPMAIAFQAAGATDDPRVAADTLSVTGRFSMTGSLADAGTVRTTYRFAGRHVGGSATVIGARGIFTISMRGIVGPVVDARQSAPSSAGGHEPARHARRLLRTARPRVDREASRLTRRAVHARRHLTCRSCPK